MHTVSPGQTTVLNVTALPSGVSVGFQVIRAASGSVAVARTTTGVFERPVGSGNYVLNFVAPVEGDLYLVVIDWTDGALAPETTRVTELQVTTQVQPGSSGLSAIADYVKMRLGGETWKGLSTSVDYGDTFIARAIELVKHQAMANPPASGDEGLLPVLVLDYLGIAAALQLIPAAIDYWGSQHISVSMGNDPTEIVTYANRANLMKDLRDELVRALPAARAAALPLIDAPVTRNDSDLPSIDEIDDYRSTADPRQFPAAEDFPGIVRPADAAGFPTRLPQRSGVRL